MTGAFQDWARSIALRAIRAVKERSIVELTDSQAWNILELAVGERISRPDDPVSYTCEQCGGTGFMPEADDT